MWERFATGLFEPLGLKVMDGKISARATDRSRSCHDLNTTGEADSYENNCNAWGNLADLSTPF